MNRPWSARLITAVLMAAFASAVLEDMPALSSGRQFGSLHIQLQAGIDERYPRLHLAALNGDGGAEGATEARPPASIWARPARTQSMLTRNAKGAVRFETLNETVCVAMTRRPASGR